MASRVDVRDSPFFKEREQKKLVVVHDIPRFDFRAYIDEYKGRSKLDRLRLISVTSTYLSFSAVTEALQTAKTLGDVAAYLELADILKKLEIPEKDLANHPEDVRAAPDEVWTERRLKQIQAETSRLESELKVYRNNMIKESIRLGQEELGRHLYNSGDHAGAIRAFGKMRDFCTTQKHLADMTIRLIVVNLAQRAWGSVTLNCTKLQTVSVKTEERQRLVDVGEVCSGLALMANGQLEHAAEAFLRVSPEYASAEPMTGITFQKDVASPNDVAVYGGLCALATMSRETLQDRLLNSDTFRQFLELEPHIRRAISAYTHSKYTACLRILNEYRTDYLLDLYLSRQYDDICARIREKSIVQYFIPFSSVTLDELAKVFPPSEAKPDLEKELIDMIQRKVLNAKIDVVDKILFAPKDSARTVTHDKALKMAGDYERALRLRLFKRAMMAADLEVPDGTGEKHAKTRGVGGYGNSRAALDLMNDESFGGPSNGAAHEEQFTRRISQRGGRGAYGGFGGTGRPT